MSKYKVDDIFWSAIEKSNAYKSMANSIILHTGDMTDNLFDRALSLTTKSMNLENEAWQHLKTINPEMDFARDRLVANHVDRTLEAKQD